MKICLLCKKNPHKQKRVIHGLLKPIKMTSAGNETFKTMKRLLKKIFQYLKKINRSNFAKNIKILVFGSVLAQIITILTAPALTRLYTPEALGGFGIFMALISAILPGIGGRYEIAAIVSSTKVMSRNFYWIAQWFSLLICIIIFFLIFVTNEKFSILFKQENSPFLLWLVPLSLFLGASISNLRAWANSIKKYAPINLSAVFQNGIFSITAISFGFFYTNSQSLILSNLVGQAAAYFYLLLLFSHVLQKKQWIISKEKISIAWQSRDYPLFNATTNILNGIMTGLPTFFLARYFNAENVGFYTLLIRVGTVPFSFISEAISRVNHKHISEIINQKENPLPYFYKITTALCAFVLFPTILIINFGPSLFAWVFGSSWKDAGIFLAILMPSIAVQFVVSTLSLSFTSAGHLRLQAFWQVTSLLATSLAFFFAGKTNDVYFFFYIYMAKDIFLYFLYYMFLIYALKNTKK